MLERHAHLLAHMVNVVVGHSLAVEDDLAAVRLFQPVQAAQERGFAAAGGADQADHIAAVNVNVDALEDIQRGGGLFVAFELLAAVGFGQAADFQNFIGHFVPASSQTLPAAG